MDKKSYHHKNLRNDLIEKGIELVNKYGAEQLSLRKVAQACGVSHAAPYSHFANKEELLVAMQNYITEQFTEMLEETICKYKEAPNFMMEFGKAYASFFIDRPQYYRFLFYQGNMCINLNLDDTEENTYKPFAIYKEQLLKIFEKLDIPQDKMQDIIIALFAYIHGLTSLATMQNVNYDKNWKDKLADLISAFSCEF